MPRPIAIAVAGAGQIGRRHIEHIRAVDGAVLSGIVDPAPAAKELAASLDVPWHPTIAALIATAKPDGLIIATPNQLHVANGLDAIAAGIPALIEKPIADDVAGAGRLVAAAEAAGVALLIGHHRRHNPMIGRAKAIIDSGRLGRIVTVHGLFWLMKPDDYFDAAWRRAAGAGPILLNLIHDIDLLRHLVGEITAVQAMQSNAIRGNAVEETAVVILRFESGALGTMNVSDTVVAPWSWEHTSAENPVYPPTDQVCYQIAGTHGSLSLPRLELWSNESARRSWFEPFAIERHIAANADPLRLQIEHFCKVIRGEATPLVSGREGLLTLKVIAAVKAAATTGQQIEIS